MLGFGFGFEGLRVKCRVQGLRPGLWDVLSDSVLIVWSFVGFKVRGCRIAGLRHVKSLQVSRS